LLRSKICDEARTIHALEIIEQSARAQNQLIGDLLDISRITLGKLRLKTRPLQLASAIASTINIVRVSAEAKQIQIESSLELELKLKV
jgi:two-component system, chemotaxis family, CheB/CheR fusion protein